MKKNVIIIVALVTVILFSVFANAYAQSKTDYYYRINAALDKLREAIDKGDKKAANIRLGDVRTAVYDAMKYLASLGQYDSRMVMIINKAAEATSKMDLRILDEAYALNNACLDSDIAEALSVVVVNHS